jgi:selenide, water dikinase
LAQVLRPLHDVYSGAQPTNLLVGLDQPDDAVLWKVDETRALVLTTDFFTPVVDDPYDYGAIAAANSLSDVYAMGGVPFLALSIAALPPELPSDFLAEIIRGGADIAKQAGVIIAGGHTIQDKEPKFGLVVLGWVDPKKYLTKKGLIPGDQLVLTKPLGFGVTTTALKRRIAAEADVQEAVGWMKGLNHKASDLAVKYNAHSCTDVTGFSLLGHGWEMAEASRVGLRIQFQSLPFISGAMKYARDWTFPGGASDNKHFYGKHVKFSDGLEEYEKMLTFDPQTSGGLLIGLSEKDANEYLEVAEVEGQPAWIIGEVIDGDLIEVLN